jgi:hypothetical protein
MRPDRCHAWPVDLPRSDEGSASEVAKEALGERGCKGGRTCRPLIRIGPHVALALGANVSYAKASKVLGRSGWWRVQARPTKVFTVPKKTCQRG